MSANDFPDLTLNSFVASILRMRWLVLLCGAFGGSLVLGVMFFSPKYQIEVDVEPPAWEALAELSQTGLVEFDRKELYSEFLHNVVSTATGQLIWEQVLKKKPLGSPNGRRLPVAAEILGGFPKDDDLVGTHRVVVVGPVQGDVGAFLRASLQFSRQRVAKNAVARLRAAVDLQLANIRTEIEQLLAGNQEELEAQRRRDRQSALQGGGFRSVPLAYLSLDELYAQQSYYQGIEILKNLDVAAQVHLDEIEEPWDWYTKMHPLAGLLVGLLMGGWLAVAWKPNSVS